MATQVSSSELSKGQWSRPIVLNTTTESDINALVTALTPAGQLRRILSVDVHYSAPVSLDVTITLKSGAGSAWDTVWLKDTLAGIQDSHWASNGNHFISDSDVLEVLAPAGGASVECGVSIYSEVF